MTHRHKLILVLALVGPMTVSCAAFKPVARTVNDAARIACKAAFGQEDLPQGVSVRDFCDAHENLQPFIDQILAAKQGIKAGMGDEQDEPDE